MLGPFRGEEATNCWRLKGEKALLAAPAGEGWFEAEMGKSNESRKPLDGDHVVSDHQVRPRISMESHLLT